MSTLSLSLSLFVFGQIIKTWTHEVGRGAGFGTEQHIKSSRRWKEGERAFKNIDFPIFCQFVIVWSASSILDDCNSLLRAHIDMDLRS